MADQPRPTNNTTDFLNRLTRLFQSGPRVRHKIPKNIAGQRSSEVMNAMQGGQYFNTRDPYIYNQANRFYRYEDFAMMEFTPIIAAALDVYASSVAGMDENRRSIIVKSGNPKIKQILNSLFRDILNFNVNLYPWARNLCKYGDFFLYLKLDPNHGVVGAEPIEIDAIERNETMNTETREREVTFKVNMEGAAELKPHQVAHFRLPFNDQFFPYGTSILDPARKIWRMLELLTDAMMVYRIVRAPERRIYKIDVGNIPPEDVDAFLEQQETRMRRQIVVDDSTGRLDLRYSALSLEHDIFIPIRGDQGSSIETLQGGSWQDGIQDIELLQSHLFAALKVPKPYLNFMDSSDASKTALTEMSIIFSEHVRRIQNSIIDELYKVAMIHLMFFGYQESDLMDFELELASSSMLAQQQAMETYRQKFEILASAPEDIPRRLLYKKIMGWDDDDIEEMTRDKIKEAKLIGMLGKLKDGDFEGASGMMGGGGFGDEDFGGDDFGGGEDFDFEGGDLGGGDDLGGGGGIEPMGGSGGADSEVEDLFAGPFDSSGASVFRTPDDVEDFARRKDHAEEAIRQAIAISPVDFIAANPVEDEEEEAEPKTDRHGRKKGKPTARKTHDRQRAPGAGRPRDPGNTVRIRGKDRDGSGRRHVAVATGTESDAIRYKNDLVKPERDRFREDAASRNLSSEYKDALSSLSSMFGEKNSMLAEQDDIDFEDISKVLDTIAEEEEVDSESELRQGAGIAPEKSQTPAEQRASSADDDEMKDTVAHLAQVAKNGNGDDDNNEDEAVRAPQTSQSKTTIVIGEGEE